MSSGLSPPSAGRWATVAAMASVAMWRNGPAPSFAFITGSSRGGQAAALHQPARSLKHGHPVGSRHFVHAGATQRFSRMASGSFAMLAPLVLGMRKALAGRRSHRQRRIQLRAYTSAPQTYEGAPIGPPPDLPSLLLKNRIVYLGTPITNEVTELIIAQLLYLNYESADKPVTMYINSTGSTVKNNTRYMGESKVGMETDAFAIADCMQYIKPQVQTIAIGQAYGTAAVLLGLGTKGKRFALPNATIMLSEPREPPAKGPRQAADIQILAREVLQNRSTMSDLLSTATGKSKDQVVKDTLRCYYMSPDDAVAYNLIDKVLTPEKIKQSQDVPSFVSAL